GSGESGKGDGGLSSLSLSLRLPLRFRKPAQLFRPGAGVSLPARIHFLEPVHRQHPRTGFEEVVLPADERGYGGNVPPGTSVSPGSAAGPRKEVRLVRNHSKLTFYEQ